MVIEPTLTEMASETCSHESKSHTLYNGFSIFVGFGLTQSAIRIKEKKIIQCSR